VDQTAKANQTTTWKSPLGSREILEKHLVPFGLGSVINNYYKDHKSMTPLYYGLCDEKDVTKDFKTMVDRVTGSGTIFRNKETGELLEVKNRSRWNKDFRYDMSVKSKLEKEVQGLRNAVLVTLTYDMGLVRQVIPDWWTLGEKVFVVLFNDMFVTNFLNKLRYWRKKQGLKWNYIGGACEFHDGKRNPQEKARFQEMSVTNKGVLHNHLIFYGGSVAPLDVIWKCWGLSQFQGVDVEKRTGLKSAVYIAKYIGKTLSNFQGDLELKELSKWFWYFRRRLFNVRHRMRGQVNKGIPSQEFEMAGVFFKDVRHMFDDDREGVKLKREERKAYNDWMKQFKGQENWVPYEDD